jgi:hypothetical protein
MATVTQVGHVETVLEQGILGEVDGQLDGVHDASTPRGVPLDLAEGDVRLLLPQVKTVGGGRPEGAG